MSRRANLATADLPPHTRRRDLRAICALSGGIGGAMLAAQFGASLGPAGVAIGPVGAIGGAIFTTQLN